MKLDRHKLKIAIGLCVAFYLAAFVIVHRSSTLRKPAANMLYWYYSDNSVIENIEFYGFWPLRQIGYHIPGFEARHNLERRKPASNTGKDADL